MRGEVEEWREMWRRGGRVRTEKRGRGVETEGRNTERGGERMEELWGWLCLGTETLRTIRST